MHLHCAGAGCGGKEEGLKKAGFSSDQAEVSVRLVIDAMNENFATKSDMKELEIALRSDMKELESGLRSDIKGLDMKIDSVAQHLRSEIREIEYKLTIKLGSMVVIAVGATATLLKLVQR